MGKGGRCVRLTTLPPSSAVVMKSGNLNFLEHSGPVQACNGTALPFKVNSYIAQRCLVSLGELPSRVSGSGDIRVGWEMAGES